MAPARNQRIDFIRGLALLVVLVDHVEGWARLPFLRSWTLVSLGFSDAAEVFVFLSGYVFGVSYSRTLSQNGFRACLAKAVKRSLQVYAAYLIAALAVIGIGGAFLSWNPPEGDGVTIGEHPLASVLQSLVFRFQPYGFPVLAFYALVLPVMPFMLLLWRRAAWAAFGISAGTYLLVQFIPALNFHRYADDRPWAFNPLAWQFLFFMGVVLSGWNGPKRLAVPRHVLMALSVGMLVLGFVAIKLVPWLADSYPTVAEWGAEFKNLQRAIGGKTLLQPLRLLHFFALAYVVSRCLPSHLSFWSSRAARPIVVCGQQSLDVYALGIVLAFLATFILSRIPDVGITAILVADLATCAMSIGFAYTRGYLKATALRSAIVDPSSALLDTPALERL